MNLLISMPIYKTIKDQSNNIKQIDTILTFPRNKKLLKYVKDNKHKADFEYPLSNDGLMYVNNEQKMIYITIHLSNTEAKLVWQLDNIVKIVNNYKDYIICILGDFNVVPMKDETVNNKLYFLKKNEKLKNLNDTKKIEILQYESRNIVCEFLYHNILYKETDYNTTCKMRALTAQIDKIFEIASDKIDTSFILYPNKRQLPVYNICHSLHYFTNSSDNTEIIENTVNENTLYPMEWLTDHSLLKSTFTIGEKTITTITLNISGESQSGDKAYNWGEFVIKPFYDFIIQNNSLSEIKNEMFTSSEIFGEPIIIDNVQINNLKELVKADKKYFCETFKNKSLRDCEAVNFHRDPSNTTNVIQYYQDLSETLNINLLKNALIDGNYSKFIKLQDIFSRIMNYTCKNNINFSNIFNYWYRLSKYVNKIKILDVLEYYLLQNVDVIALQEVSILGGSKVSTLYFIQNLIITKYKNYVLVKPLYNYVDDKTVGLLIIKKSLTTVKNINIDNDSKIKTNQKNIDIEPLFQKLEEMWIYYFCFLNIKPGEYDIYNTLINKIRINDFVFTKDDNNNILKMIKILRVKCDKFEMKMLDTLQEVLSV